MMKRNIVIRLIISLILSFVFKIGINAVDGIGIDQLTLKIINCVCSFIVILPILPILKTILTDTKFKVGKWKALRICILIWIAFLVIGNIYIITTGFSGV